MRHRSKQLSVLKKRRLPLSVEELERRELLSVAANSLLESFYHDLLQRSPDSFGMAGWGGMLAHGSSPATVAMGIEQSPECRSDQVRDLYATLLRRLPESAGLDSFVGAMGSGTTAEQTAAIIIASPEYYESQSVESDPGFLSGIYRDFLGRAPDQLGQASWTAAMQAGMSRQEVALGFLTSPEYRQLTIQGYYESLLHRAPDAPGLQSWLAHWQTGMTLVEIVAGFLGSPEYQNDVAAWGSAGPPAGMSMSGGLNMPMPNGICIAPVGLSGGGGCTIGDYVPVVSACDTGGSGERIKGSGVSRAGVVGLAGGGAVASPSPDGSASGVGELLKSAPGV